MIFREHWEEAEVSLIIGHEKTEADGFVFCMCVCMIMCIWLHVCVQILCIWLHVCA